MNSLNQLYKNKEGTLIVKRKDYRFIKSLEVIYKTSQGEYLAVCDRGYAAIIYPHQAQKPIWELTEISESSTLKE
jgi:hypothetical protein